MKELIKSIAPEFALKMIKGWLDSAKLIKNFYYDYSRFSKHYVPATKTSKSSKEGLEGWILQDKHRLEKGFSLPNPRYGFGREVIERLTNNLSIYQSQFGKTEVYYIGTGAIKAYIEFHKGKTESIFPKFHLLIEFLKADFSNVSCDVAGYLYGDKLLSSSLSLSDYNCFAKSRVSCRDFDETKDVDKTLLSELIKVSMSTPSVCNRQHWRVHFFSGELKNKVLSFQNGNTGFTNNIPMIAVISSDLSAFYIADERNQPFLDCGMFAMNLMYAMNAAGLDSCALNWCLPSNKESKFMDLGLIPSNEVVSLVIAFGYRNSGCRKAKSPRIAHHTVYTIHE